METRKDVNMTKRPTKSQIQTLEFFASRKSGAWTKDLKDALSITYVSARSRITRCHTRGWLVKEEEDGPKGVMFRFSLSGDGRDVLVEEDEKSTRE